MKIALVSGSYPPMKCGIGDYTARLAESLDRLGNSAGVVTSREAGMPQAHLGERLLPEIENWDWAGRWALVTALSRLAPDIVNIQYPTQSYQRHVMINFAPYVVRRALKLPVVYTVHEYGSFSWIGRLRVALSVFMSSAAIVPDQVNLALMALNFPMLKGRLHWVPLGPNIEPKLLDGYERDLWRARCGAGRDVVLLSYFGFLSPSKGVETLLEALVILHATHPTLDWRLLLIADRHAAHSQYASYHSRIEELLRERPVQGRVCWTGFSSPEEVSGYLLASDMCVMPFADGASLRRTTLLSAMAHGLPVVSTRPKGELDPHLVDAQNILLVPADDAEALAHSIRNLAGDGEARLRLAHGAIELAHSFSWEDIGRRALDVYRGTIVSQLASGKS